jgi:tRNA-splicing ligase RtcB
VVATEGVVVPAWVGYDIGCGMCAVQTSFNADDVRTSGSAIFDEIYKHVPVGFHVNEQPIDCDLNPDDLTELGRKAFDGRKGFRAIGTLGGGNHFIEIGCDMFDAVWIIIHSGSRGVGHGVATEYMRLASGTGKVKEGHFGLDVKSGDGLCYINDLNWALKFALANREEMLWRVEIAMSKHCFGQIAWSSLINRNHNHAEERDGLWIHRKGATHAEAGMMGVIPGNMRDGSFIVRGKGNPDALWSSSHGAGRVLGRKQAKRELMTDEFMETMKGITAKVGDSTLDESPMAYKDIFEVMRLQSDLVDVIAHVKPMINIKG